MASISNTVRSATTPAKHPGAALLLQQGYSGTAVFVKGGTSLPKKGSIANFLKPKAGAEQKPPETPSDTDPVAVTFGIEEEARTWFFLAASCTLGRQQRYLIF